jgi:uncharacterized membrane protein (DUF4010 family)
LAGVELPLLGRLAVALALGLLIGAQRERTHGRVAGLRTFGLISLLGAFGAEMLPAAGPWLLVVGLIATVVLLVVGARVAHPNGEPDPGQTTEFAGLVTYCIGAWTVVGEPITAVVAAGAMVVLLQAKTRLHALVSDLGETDFRALVQLVLIGLVGLPLIPDWRIGPNDVLAARTVAWMVVAISGLSLAGYFAWRRFGSDRGALVGGVLGGLVSSTATTFAVARRSVGDGGAAPRASAAMILLASTVVWGRVLGEIAVVAPAVLSEIWLPLSIAAVPTLATALVVWRSGRSEPVPQVEHANPAQLGAAFGFGILYAAVLVGVELVRDFLGPGWLFVAAAAAGLTDMDAITLSTATLVRDGLLAADTAWRLIVTAALANLVFKFGIVFALGHTALRRALITPAAVVFAVTLVVLLLF